jgi:dolichol-phosphate mannosyltransferase
MQDVEPHAHNRIGVVVPCFRVREQILGVLRRIGPEVERIYVVDDKCPENSGDRVERECTDSRVVVIRHADNQGVGGAVMTGYSAALEDDCDVIVKIDGDGQMDPALLPEFVGPILAGDADYTKGNRFFDLDGVASMPGVRLFGNAVLSLMSKLSSGYWDLFDPTNGYTAIHADVARRLPLQKISRRYFFESDMLFRLGVMRAVVIDIPMQARYAGESSSLRIAGVVPEFFGKHLRNLAKRIFYSYYLRDLSVASIELPLGAGLIAFGLVFGAARWMASINEGIPASAGTVMLASLPILMGLQLLLSFLAYDIANVPRYARHRRFANRRNSG